MRRRLPNLLTALSLLLCVAVVALWVRSYYSGDQLRHDWSDPVRLDWRVISLNSGDGRIFGSRETATYDSRASFDEYVGRLPRWSGWDWKVRDVPGSGWPGRGTIWNNLGFYRVTVFFPGFGGPNLISHRVQFPHWAPAVLFGVLPAVRLIMILRGRRRTTASLCRRCGYDLRATPDRCPECGEPARTGSV